MTKESVAQSHFARHLHERIPKGTGMERTEVTDLYQASWYLVGGCSILEVECIKAGSGTSCRILVEGEALGELTEHWYNRTAVVNLWAFRNAYSEINTHVQQAKRSFELQKRFGRGAR